jgi:hypothetical protein
LLIGARKACVSSIGLHPADEEKMKKKRRGRKNNRRIR